MTTEAISRASAIANLVFSGAGVVLFLYLGFAVWRMTQRMKQEDAKWDKARAEANAKHEESRQKAHEEFMAAMRALPDELECPNCGAVLKKEPTARVLPS